MVALRVSRGTAVLLLLLLLCVVANALRESAQIGDQSSPTSNRRGGSKFKPKSTQRPETTSSSPSTTRSSRRFGTTPKLEKNKNIQVETTSKRTTNFKSARSHESQINKEKENIHSKREGGNRRYLPQSGNDRRDRKKDFDIEIETPKENNSSQNDRSSGPSVFSSATDTLKRLRTGRKIQTTYSPREIESKIPSAEQYSSQIKEDIDVTTSDPRRLRLRSKDHRISQESNENSTEALTISKGKRKLDPAISESESVKLDIPTNIDVIEQSAGNTYEVTEYPEISFEATDIARFSSRKEISHRNIESQTRRPIDRKKTQTTESNVEETTRKAIRSRSSSRKEVQRTTEIPPEVESRRRTSSSRSSGRNSDKTRSRKESASRSRSSRIDSTQETTEPQTTSKRRVDRRSRTTERVQENRSRPVNSRSSEVSQRKRNRGRLGSSFDGAILDEPVTALSAKTEAFTDLSRISVGTTGRPAVTTTLRTGRKESDRTNGERRKTPKEDFFNHGLGFRGRKPTVETPPPAQSDTITTTPASTIIKSGQQNRGNPGWTLKRRPGYSNEFPTASDSSTSNEPNTLTDNGVRGSRRGNGRGKEEGQDEAVTTTSSTNRGGRRGNKTFGKGSGRNRENENPQENDNYPPDFKARVTQLKNSDPNGALPIPRTTVEDRKKLSSALFAARSRAKLENARKLIKPELVLDDQESATSDSTTVVTDSEVKETRKVEKFSKRYSGRTTTEVPKSSTKESVTRKFSKSRKQNAKTEEPNTNSRDTKRGRGPSQRYRQFSKAKKGDENNVIEHTTKSSRTKNSQEKLIFSVKSRLGGIKTSRKNAASELVTSTEPPKTRISIMRGKITESTSRITVKPKKVHEKLLATSSFDENSSKLCENSTEDALASTTSEPTTSVTTTIVQTKKFESPLTRLLNRYKENEPPSLMKPDKHYATDSPFIVTPVSVHSYVTSPRVTDTLEKNEADTESEENHSVTGMTPNWKNIFDTSNEIDQTSGRSVSTTYKYDKETNNPPLSDSESKERRENRPRTATYRRHSEIPINLFKPATTTVQPVAITPKLSRVEVTDSSAPQSVTQIPAISVQISNASDSSQQNVGISGSSNGESGNSNIFNPARSALLASGNSSLLEQIRSTVAPLLNSLGTKSSVFSGAYRNTNSANSVARVTPSGVPPKFTARYSGAEVFVRRPTYQSTTPMITSSTKLFTPAENLGSPPPFDIMSPGEPKVVTFYHAVESAGIVNEQPNLQQNFQTAQVDEVIVPKVTNSPNNDIIIVAKVEPVTVKITSIKLAANSQTTTDTPTALPDITQNPDVAREMTETETLETTLSSSTFIPESEVEDMSSTTDKTFDQNLLEPTEASPTITPATITVATNILSRYGKVLHLFTNQVDDEQLTDIVSTTTQNPESTTEVQNSIGTIADVNQNETNSSDSTTEVSITAETSGSIDYINDKSFIVDMNENETTVTSNSSNITEDSVTTDISYDSLSTTTEMVERNTLLQNLLNLTDDIVYVNDASTTTSSLDSSENSTESSITSTKIPDSVDSTILSDSSTETSSTEPAFTEPITDSGVIFATTDLSTTTDLTSKIILEVLTQFRGPTPAIEKLENINVDQITDNPTTEAVSEDSNETTTELTEAGQTSTTEAPLILMSTTEFSDSMNTSFITGAAGEINNFNKRLFNLTSTQINTTPTPITTNLPFTTTDTNLNTEDSLLSRLMKLAARIFPETMSVMQLLPSEKSLDDPLQNDINQNNSPNTNVELNTLESTTNDAQQTNITTPPTVTQLANGTTEVSTTLQTQNTITDLINSVDDSQLTTSIETSTNSAPESTTSGQLPVTPTFLTRFQETTPATAQGTAGTETQPGQSTQNPQITTIPSPTDTPTTTSESVDDNLIITDDLSTSTQASVQMTSSIPETTTQTTTSTTSGMTPSPTMQYLGRFGGSRITPAPRFSSSSSTTTPLRDYLVYGIYPNKTIVRKRPEDNLIDARNVDSPYVIFGIYPDGKLVRKFPNGTVIPDPPSNPVEVVFTLSTTTTTTTTNRPRPVFLYNNNQVNQIMRNQNAVFYNNRSPVASLDGQGDLFSPNDVDVGLSSNSIGPTGSANPDTLTSGSSGSISSTSQQMSDAMKSMKTITASSSQPLSLNFKSTSIVGGSNSSSQGGRIIQNRERDEATRTSEAEGQRGSMYTGQEKIVNYWTNGASNTNPQVLGIKINSVSTAVNEGQSSNLPIFNIQPNSQSGSQISTASNFPWKDPLDQIFGITTDLPTITASVASNILEETNSPRSLIQTRPISPFVEIFDPRSAIFKTTTNSPTTTTNSPFTTTSSPTTTTNSPTTIPPTTTIMTTEPPMTTTEPSTTTTMTTTTEPPTTTTTVAPIIITPETTTTSTTTVPTVPTTMTTTPNWNNPFNADVKNQNAFGTSFDDLAFLNALLYSPGKVSSTPTTLTEVEQLLANKIISLALGKEPENEGPTRSPKAIQQGNSNTFSANSLAKPSSEMVTTETPKPSPFTWKPVITQNPNTPKLISASSTITTTSSTSTTTTTPSTTTTSSTTTTTPSTTTTTIRTTVKPVATTRRTVVITSKPRTTTKAAPPQGIGETLLRALFGGNLFAPGTSTENSNSNEQSVEFNQRPKLSIKSTQKPVQTTLAPVQFTTQKVENGVSPPTAGMVSDAIIAKLQLVTPNSIAQDSKLESSTSSALLNNPNPRVPTVYSSTYSPEDDAKFLAALLQAAQTKDNKSSGSAAKAVLTKEDEEFLKTLLNAQSNGQSDSAAGTAVGNEAALLAALLKSEGLEPTTPNNLRQQLQLASLEKAIAQSSTNKPKISTTTTKRPVIKKTAPKSKPSSTIWSPSSTYPPPLFGGFNFGASSPNQANQDSAFTNGGSSIRSQVVNAALGVTRAFSQFLGAAITGAAQQLQSFVNGTRYVTVSG